MSKMPAPAWVTEHVDVDHETAAIVRAIEYEFMVGAGIALHDCDTWTGLGCTHRQPRWYSPDDLGGIGATRVVDHERLAKMSRRCLAFRPCLRMSLSGRDRLPRPGPGGSRSGTAPRVSAHQPDKQAASAPPTVST